MAVPDTLRGFRTQFLYTMYRVVCDNNPERIYIPEGQEDLDIIEDGVIVEVVQVKNLTAPLTYSNLHSSANSTSFFQRCQVVVTNNPYAKLKLASFGAISRQLRDLDRLTTALKNDVKISNDKITPLVSSFTAENVNEDDLYDNIIERLKSKFPSFNGEWEVRYLLQWISELAENQQFLTLTRFYNELLALREVEVKQGISQSQLGVRVKRLFKNDKLDESNSILKEEFLKGVSARPIHILGSVDLKRSKWLDKIDEAFKTQNILIIHGISGQGKSSLCYRYIKDFETFGFEINDCNPSSLEEIKATVQEISSGLHTHVLIYFDCQPGEKEWPNLVREFGRNPHVRILVSIREEDWQLSKHLINEYVSYNELSLTLTKEEAYQIFQIFVSKNKKKIFIDKWEELGESAPLLEFIYSITHGETLKSKLTNQYRHLSLEQQQIVSAIIIPLYLGGVPTEETILKLENLNPLTLSTLLSPLEEEYFIKDGIIYKDIHPVRTSILKEIICNGSSELLVRIGLFGIGRLNIKESSRYIVNLFKEGMNLDDFFNRLDEFDHLPANLCYEVIKALLWKGCHDYVKRNSSHIENLRELIGIGWSCMLPINYTDIELNTSIQDLFKNFKNLFDSLKAISDRMDPQGKVFDCIRYWLENRKIKISQLQDYEYDVFGKLLYLLSLENMTSAIDSSSLSITPINLHSHEYAYLLLGLKSAGIHNNEWGHLEKSFIKNLREEHSVYSLAFYESEIDSKILIDLRNGFDYDEKPVKSPSASRFINKRVVRVCELLRMAFPDKSRFSCELEVGEIGYLMIDRVKTISKQNLPVNLMRLPRRMIYQISEHETRIENKRLYFERTIWARQKYVECASTLNCIFKYWIKGETVPPVLISKSKILLDEVRTISNIELPASVLDPTLIRENEEEINLIDKNTPIANYSSTFDKYTSSISNFFNQFLNTLTDRTANKFLPQYNLLEAINESKMLQQFTFTLGNPYSTNDDLEKLVKQEQSVLDKLFIFWNNISQESRHISTPESVENEWEQRKKTLPTQFINNLKISFESCGFTPNIVFSERQINISLLYQSIQIYPYIKECFLDAIIKSLVPYEYLSAEYVMMTQQIDSITLTEAYLYDSQEYSMTGTSFSVTMHDAFLLKETQNPISFIKGERNNSKINIEELYIFDKLQGILLSMSLTASQIHSAKENIVKTDNEGLYVINNYSSRYKQLEFEFITQINNLKQEATVMADKEITDEVFALCDKIENLCYAGLWLNSLDTITQITEDINSMNLGYKAFVIKDYIQRHHT